MKALIYTKSRGKIEIDLDDPGIVLGYAKTPSGNTISGVISVGKAAGQEVVIATDDFVAAAPSDQANDRFI